MKDSYERTTWNALYAQEDRGRHWSHEPDATLVELASRLQPGTVIDLGAGEGRNSLWLAEHGWEVCAVDVSDLALQRLEATAQHRDLVIRTVPMRFKEFAALGEQADLVVVANIHPELHLRQQFFNLVAEMVRSGGYVYVIGHHLEAHGHVGPEDADRMYTEESLLNTFPEFEVQRLDVIHSATDQAEEQHAASVMLIARKS